MMATAEKIIENGTITSVGEKGNKITVSANNEVFTFSLGTTTTITINRLYSQAGDLVSHQKIRKLWYTPAGMELTVIHVLDESRKDVEKKDAAESNKPHI